MPPKSKRTSKRKQSRRSSASRTKRKNPPRTSKRTSQRKSQRKSKRTSSKKKAPVSQTKIPLVSGVKKRLSQAGEKTAITALSLGGLAAFQALRPSLRKAKSEVSVLVEPTTVARQSFANVVEEKTKVADLYGDIQNKNIKLFQKHTELIAIRQNVTNIHDDILQISKKLVKRNTGEAVSNEDRNFIETVIKNFEQIKESIENNSKELKNTFNQIELDIAKFKTDIAGLVKNSSEMNNAVQRLIEEKRKIKADIKRKGNIAILGIKEDPDIDEIAESRGENVSLPSSQELKNLTNEVAELNRNKREIELRFNEAKLGLVKEITDITALLINTRRLTDQLEVDVIEIQPPAQIAQPPEDPIDAAFSQVKPRIPKRRFPKIRQDLKKRVNSPMDRNTLSKELLHLALGIRRDPNFVGNLPMVYEEISPDDIQKIFNVLNILARNII